MTKNENLRLCGGTFFTLLLEANQMDRIVESHFSGLAKKY